MILNNPALRLLLLATCLSVCACDKNETAETGQGAEDNNTTIVTFTVTDVSGRDLQCSTIVGPPNVVMPGEMVDVECTVSDTGEPTSLTFDRHAGRRQRTAGNDDQ